MCISNTTVCEPSALQAAGGSEEIWPAGVHGIAMAALSTLLELCLGPASLRRSLQARSGDRLEARNCSLTREARDGIIFCSAPSIFLPSTQHTPHTCTDLQLMPRRHELWHILGMIDYYVTRACCCNALIHTSHACIGSAPLDGGRWVTGHAMRL